MVIAGDLEAVDALASEVRSTTVILVLI